MPKRLSKNPTDPNVMAFQIVQAATGHGQEPAKKKPRKKNPAAVALGRLGGEKGGRARADSLSPEKRKEIALLAARARWGVKP